MNYSEIFNFVIVWTVCGVLGYGATFAYFQKEFELISHDRIKSDRHIAFITGIFGPIGLLVAFVLSDFFKYGFKWK